VHADKDIGARGLADAPLVEAKHRETQLRPVRRELRQIAAGRAPGPVAQHDGRKGTPALR
jgi:hypothetical protein